MGGEAVNEGGEGPAVSQQRGDVAEEDPGLGEVRDLPQVVQDQLGQARGDTG